MLGKWRKEDEIEIAQEWKERKVYAFKLGKKIFSIDTPPPYVNTPAHMGHAASYAIMDMIARHRRMTRWSVLFPLGLDRNGLPIEIAAEERFGVKLNALPRQQALELCRKILEEASAESIDTFFRLGFSFNSWEIGTKPGQIYLTDSPEYRALTQASFIELWNRGLIYQESRITNWCPGCGTAIADAEIEYETRPAIWHDVVFKVKETGEELIISTTRPELLCTCGMVIFNPEDDRYKHLAGKTALTPIYKKEVPIIAHPSADPKKGTGLVMMCSAGDLSDIRFFREQGLKPLIAITADGRMNEIAGPLAGLKVDEARAKAAELLEKSGLLKAKRSAEHKIPVCERSGDPIEFIEMPELYLKQVEFKQELLKLAHQLNFFAPESRQRLIDWIGSISIDWPISRRRFYGTEIPLWYCSCGYAVLPKPGSYVRPWQEPAPIKSCPKCGGSSFTGEQRVFDTWFDSAMTPLYILGWARAQKLFERAQSCSLRPQGKDIIRTWLYYTLLKCWLLTGKCIFRDVWINHMILDEKGKKMSKSAGNVIDPKEVIDRYGSDALRLWVAVEGDLTKQDFKCSFARIEGAAKTIQKFWNVAKFISSFPKAKARPTPLDRLILAEVNRLVQLANSCYAVYDFHRPAIALKHFIWEIFASNYIELVKPRAYNRNRAFTSEAQAAAHFTLYTVLEILLRLLAPIIPFVTYKIYKELFGKDVHATAFPKPKVIKGKWPTAELLKFNSEIWKSKKAARLALNSPIQKLQIPKVLKRFAKDLAAAHNAAEIEFV